ncbi:unnamed protein product [Cylicostephanus goldi]|uniref:Globin family profile domain-containing protein n=1 Tax=Cylicostephanus goldi TaxID=71465 RepID=A0A3P7MPB5_CYLGO|nr:unnamed protein product [Cylicostephanus goldi]
MMWGTIILARLSDFFEKRRCSIYWEDLEEIREIGARHVPLKHECGLGAAELDRFQEIFVEVMLKQDGIRQSKEAR